MNLGEKTTEYADVASLMMTKMKLLIYLSSSPICNTLHAMLTNLGMETWGSKRVDWRFFALSVTLFVPWSVGDHDYDRDHDRELWTVTIKVTLQEKWHGAASSILKCFLWGVKGVVSYSCPPKLAQPWLCSWILNRLCQLCKSIQMLVLKQTSPVFLHF